MCRPNSLFDFSSNCMCRPQAVTFLAFFFFKSHAESMSNKLSCEILVLSLSSICSSSAMIFHLMFLFYLHANV